MAEVESLCLDLSLEANCERAVERYFFASSVCVYSTALQSDCAVDALKEADAYPAMAERGYGWEKRVGEMFCQGVRRSS